MKKENILVIVLIGIAFAGIYVYAKKPAGQYAPSPEPPVPGILNKADAKPVAPVVATKSNGDGNGIRWNGYTPGLARAEKEDKNVFLYFYADWCTYCTKLKKETFRDKKVRAYLEDHYISIAVDTEKDQEMARKWRVNGLPTLWFLTAGGEKIKNLPGYVDANQFLQVLKYIRTKSYDTMSFQEFVQQG